MANQVAVQFASVERRFSRRSGGGGFSERDRGRSTGRSTWIDLKSFKFAAAGPADSSTPLDCDFAALFSRTRRLHQVCADRAFQFGPCHRIVMQGLDFRRARLRQRSLRVKHVQLRAGAG